LLKQFENMVVCRLPQKNIFDAVAISVAFVSEIEAVAAAGVVQWVRAIDEKHCVVDVVFLS